MPVSRSLAPTASAARYMTQLCKHWSHKLDVEYDDRTGKIRFDDDRSCVLHATPEGLEIEIETADDEQLERTQRTLTTHLNRFAFREPFGDLQWRRME